MDTYSCVIDGENKWIVYHKNALKFGIDDDCPISDLPYKHPSYSNFNHFSYCILIVTHVQS